ncbi:hypothetical protein HMPREF1401_01180 [Helicobacter pylori GAM120Ai]|uniref:Uncharacterized protein n=1 Tax=Helicobacter pylori GAM120Ai TaxID=1159029 RepID=A0AAV3IEP2_HELPX|nr:hypothetical protein HMPREF1401_01180 [Helicobacter pylori GAM120Ai]
MKISINPPKSSSVIQLKTFQRFGSVLRAKAETHPINFLIFSVFICLFSKGKLFECFLRLFGCVC